ncbi:hypothetical protein KIN20_004014 [Parelaphostrongylus tenuis]|uniref:Uncharacterized protein n=1 Tax=Parelaphostrongylus tenuis TaxID=148309 RepID=A0AAD5LXR4_PARTN|nr:hypothetical protein KIN20_004014 [Parelaphostrongylus tenuis]
MSVNGNHLADSKQMTRDEESSVVKSPVRSNLTHRVQIVREINTDTKIQAHSTTFGTLTIPAGGRSGQLRRAAVVL